MPRRCLTRSSQAARKLSYLARASCLAWKYLSKELNEIFFIPRQAALPEKAAPDQLPDKAAVPEKTYSFEDVRGIMSRLSGQGKKAEARALLLKYGVTHLSDLAEKDYAALAEEAQVIANS